MPVSTANRSDRQAARVCGGGPDPSAEDLNTPDPGCFPLLGQPLFIFFRPQHRPVADLVVLTATPTQESALD